MKACTVVGAIGVLGVVATLSTPKSDAAVTTTPIKHVVVIYKENRSFDEYFGRFPGANGATTGKMSDGTIVNLGVTPDPMPNDISHDPKTWAIAYNGGQMNQFDKEGGAFSASGQPLAYSQMRESGIPNYWLYAKQFALADNYFAAWKGASFANNLYSIAGQAGIYDPTLGHQTVYSNPFSPSGVKLPFWGCDDPADTTVPMINPDTMLQSQIFPCFNFRAMPNILANHAVSWKFYSTLNAQSLHNPLDALKPVRYDPALWANVQPVSHFYDDAAATLPEVSWIAGSQMEHPPGEACNGENQTVQMVNAIMNGPNWSSTVILIAWDEWGGFYDHVAPPQIDGLSYGFRTPLLVISPFTKPGSSARGGSINHTFNSSVSQLKFIEANWGLPSLTPRDQAASNLMDMFDFNQKRPKLLLTERACPAMSAALEAQIEAPGRDPD